MLLFQFGESAQGRSLELVLFDSLDICAKQLALIESIAYLVFLSCSYHLVTKFNKMSVVIDEIKYSNQEKLRLISHK